MPLNSRTSASPSATSTIALFTDLGLTVLGRDTVSGERADTAVGLDGNHTKIAMLQTPDGKGCLELFAPGDGRPNWRPAAPAASS